jgi:acyl-coenzyme A synthetase/AMP-(fatty) acid ligase
MWDDGFWHHGRSCRALNTFGHHKASQKVEAHLLNAEQLSEAADVEFGARLYPEGCTCYQYERGLCPKCQVDSERLWEESR